MGMTEFEETIAGKKITYTKLTTLKAVEEEYHSTISFQGEAEAWKTLLGRVGDWKAAVHASLIWNYSGYPNLATARNKIREMEHFFKP